MFNVRNRLLTSLLAASLLLLPTTSFAESIVTPDASVDLISSQDAIVLKASVGNGPGELGYLIQEGGKEGPEAFTVAEDQLIYIADNVNKRVNVYKNGSFSYEIAIPFSHYIRGIAVSQDRLYLLDNDKGSIFVASLQGELLQEVPAPAGVEGYAMEKLYKDNTGKVWLSANQSSYPVSQEPALYSSAAAGISESTKLPLTLKKDQKTAQISQNGAKIEIAASELLGSVNVLSVDQNNSLYVELFDQVDTAKVSGEYTVRKYAGSKLTAVAPIDLSSYYFTPNTVIELTASGDLYQILCSKDQVTITKKAFVPSASFKSKLPQIKAQALKEAAAESLQAKAITLASNAPNTRAVAQTNANNMSALTWKYSAANKVNPNSSNVKTPDYLVSAATGSTQTGIPYAWGGNDGLTTHSTSSWTSFADAISKGKFAGNVNTDTSGYQTGTAGLDCSGFVGSAAGFTSKLSTTNLASSTYTASIPTTSRQIYDIYVKSGSHVLFFTGENGSSINTREATTTGDDKTKAYSRTTTYLSSEGYVLRRFNGW
jgi:hypothetical protein